jgi:putative inorganic carbon (hco3(-)) transporter
MNPVHALRSVLYNAGSSEVTHVGVAAALAAVTSLSMALVIPQTGVPAVLLAMLTVLALVSLLLKPEIATLVAVFLLYINFPAFLTKEVGLPRVMAGSFILLLAVPLISSVIARRAPLRTDSTLYLLLALAAAYMLSSINAIDRGIASSSILELLTEGVLLYFLLVNAIRNMATLRRVIWTVVLAGSMLSALSLYQSVTGSYEQEFWGFAQRGYVESAEELPNAVARRQTWDRARGPVGQPNRFAQTLLVLVPLAVYAFRTAGTHRMRMLAACAALLLLGGMATTLSRGASLALVIAVSLMLAFRWLRPTHALAGALVLALVAANTPFLVERISTIRHTAALRGDGDPLTRSAEADGALLGRTTLMLSALNVFRDRPFLGVGPGQFPPFYSVAYSRNPDIKFRDMPDRAWRAHSLYLELAAETGVLGLTVFIMAMAATLKRLWRLRSYWSLRSTPHADMATALFLALVTYLVSGTIQHLAYQRYFWFLVALAGAAAHVLLVEATSEEYNKEQV